MKKIIVAVLLAVTFFACKSRNVNKRSSEIEISETKLKDVKIDCTSVAESNLKINTNNNIWIFEPVDSSKPMLIDGKEYLNSKVTNDSSKKEHIGNRKEKSVINKSVNEGVISNTSVKEKVKLSESKGGEFIFVYYILVIISLVIAYYFIRKIKK